MKGCLWMQARFALSLCAPPVAFGAHAVSSTPSWHNTHPCLDHPLSHKNHLPIGSLPKHFEHSKLFIDTEAVGFPDLLSLVEEDAPASPSFSLFLSPDPSRGAHSSAVFAAAHLSAACLCEETAVVWARRGQRVTAAVFLIRLGT